MWLPWHFWKRFILWSMLVTLHSICFQATTSSTGFVIAVHGCIFPVSMGDRNYKDAAQSVRDITWLFLFQWLWMIAFFILYRSCDSVNVSVGEKEERMMMTGLHTVADIFCVSCGSIVGWKYVRPIYDTWFLNSDLCTLFRSHLWGGVFLSGGCSWKEPKIQGGEVHSWEVVEVIKPII